MISHRSSLSGRQFARSILRLVAVALLWGCAVGPDFHRPGAPAADSYTRPPAIAKTVSAEIPGGRTTFRTEPGHFASVVDAVPVA